MSGRREVNLATLPLAKRMIGYCRSGLRGRWLRGSDRCPHDLFGAEMGVLQSIKNRPLE
jgi:hypothetical protein